MFALLELNALCSAIDDLKKEELERFQKQQSLPALCRGEIVKIGECCDKYYRYTSNKFCDDIRKKHDTLDKILNNKIDINHNIGGNNLGNINHGIGNIRGMGLNNFGNNFNNGGLNIGNRNFANNHVDIFENDRRCPFGRNNVIHRGGAANFYDFNCGR